MDDEKAIVDVSYEADSSQSILDGIFQLSIDTDDNLGENMVVMM